MAIDRFVFQHQDFTVLVAAGNHANRTKRKSQISAASSTFNCITVWAAGPTRLNDMYRFDNKPRCEGSHTGQRHRSLQQPGPNQAEQRRER